jgi:gamma-glutamyltranspeptidase/glutathione hydrolase
LIAADMAANGGVITSGDLARYRAVEAAPIEIRYRGVPVLMTPPSSSGGAALAAMLNTLDQFEMKIGMEGSSAARHLQIEAMRIGFGVRTRWMRGTDTAERLVSREYAQEESQKIDLTRATTTSTQAATESESQDTTHFTVADAEGNIVTNTYTLSGFYGSQVIAKGTGVLLNNHMSAFPREALKPNRRYASTMTPTMILRPDRKPWAAFGTPGGATIPSTLMQIVMNLVDFKMTLRDAIEFPRLHFAGAGNVDAEPAALVFDVAERLRGMGHRISPNLRSQGDVNAVVIEEDTGWKQGWADGRRGGVVRGY